MKSTVIEASKRGSKGLAALVVSIIAIAACGAGTASTDPNTGTDTGDPSIADNVDDEGETDGNSTIDDAEDDTSGMDDFHTLIAVVNAEPKSVDMMALSSGTVVWIGNNIFETLFTPDSGLVPRPMLAESFDVSDDGMEYTIFLRNDVKFANGERMTAHDVEASLQRWQLLSSAGNDAAGDIEAVLVVDELTVKIVLNKARYGLVPDLAYFLQAAIIMPKKVVEEYGEDIIPSEDAIGTGPYRVAEHVVGQRILLTRNEHYSPRSETDWGGYAGRKEANIDAVEYRFVSDPTQQLNGLKTGQYHWASGISPDALDQVRGNDDLTYQLVDNNLIFTILFNLKDSVFSDPNTRRALNMILDKEEIAVAAIGNDKDMWSPLNGGFASSNNALMHSDNGTDIYRQYDPAKAKELFESAGVSADNEIRILTSKAYPKYYQASLVIQQALSQIGMNAVLDVLDWSAVIDRQAQDSGWDISMSSYPGSSMSPNQLIPTHKPLNEEVKTKISEYLAEYQDASDQESAKNVVDALQQYIWEDAVFLSLFPTNSFQVFSSALDNMNPMDYGIFYNATFDK